MNDGTVQHTDLRPISDIAQKLGLAPSDIVQLGPWKAKIPLDIIYQHPRKARTVLMTSINPTPPGEGKTTMSIGLADAMRRRGVKATAVLREPSLGPTFGMKGGATGGGQAQIEPARDINLHFTGDFHAITAAHNLLAALVDNELYHGTRLSGVKPGNVTLKRVLDVNDRSLRHIVIGLGGPGQGVVRETGFDITAASEVMAILTLSKDLAELRERLSRMIIARSGSGFVSVAELGAEDALTTLLTDAIMPNLVQTREHTPAIVHGGPFANIAHGCNSIIATEAGLRFSDVVITEAGFGADMGAEKFLDIKAPTADLNPDVAVVVVTLRALRYHGGQALKDTDKPDQAALERGCENLEKHLANLKSYGLPVVVGINRFESDSDTEIQWLINHLAQQDVPAAPATVFREGGAGGEELARVVEGVLEQKTAQYRPLYTPDMPVVNKIRTIAEQIYGAARVDFGPQARTALKRIERWGLNDLGVCIAKTQYSLSDDPSRLGRPRDFTLNIRDIEISRGAGYVVPLAGSMIRMPGLPKDPAAFKMTPADN